MRIVCPDLEHVARNYISLTDRIYEGDNSIRLEHEKAIHGLLHQLVGDAPDHNIDESNFVRFVERILRGTARDMGWSHRWMYDKFSLRRLLECRGFYSIKVLDAYKSDILDFNHYYLDVDSNGIPYYSTGSIHLEARKP